MLMYFTTEQEDEYEVSSVPSIVTAIEHLAGYENVFFRHSSVCVLTYSPDLAGYPLFGENTEKYAAWRSVGGHVLPVFVRLYDLPEHLVDGSFKDLMKYFVDGNIQRLKEFLVANSLMHPNGSIAFRNDQSRRIALKLGINLRRVDSKFGGLGINHSQYSYPVSERDKLVPSDIDKVELRTIYGTAVAQDFENVNVDEKLRLKPLITEDEESLRSGIQMYHLANKLEGVR